MPYSCQPVYHHHEVCLQVPCIHSRVAYMHSNSSTARCIIFDVLWHYTWYQVQYLISEHLKEKASVWHPLCRPKSDMLYTRVGFFFNGRCVSNRLRQHLVSFLAHGCGTANDRKGLQILHSGLIIMLLLTAPSRCFVKICPVKIKPNQTK